MFSAGTGNMISRGLCRDIEAFVWRGEWFAGPCRQKQTTRDLRDVVTARTGKSNFQFWIFSCFVRDLRT